MEDGRRRAVIESVQPEVDEGRFPVRRVLGEEVVVEADVFADGHDELAAVVRYRAEDSAEWSEAAMAPVVNDRWRGGFRVQRLVPHRFTIEAWVDRYATWVRDLGRRVGAGQDVTVELRVGAALLRQAARRAGPEDARALTAAARSLAGRRGAERALEPALAALAGRHPDRSLATVLPREVTVAVDPALARFSAWYEMFPRSASPDPARPGTLRDVEARLAYVAQMGFDVLYLPPIHPVGRAFRKGRNNTTTPTPADTGSPWAIGGPEGGHKAIDPGLGTFADFRSLVRAAGRQGLAVALDIAFQASPDHPYVSEHPEWFRARPDGTIQYAENPPKRYQDIYPFDFECADWRGLWEELRSVFDFWVDQGVRVFRVDNPHTKPFGFWEWVLAAVRSRQPDVVFLSEAFTHPKVMYRLAKLGFSQSYTYFAWRNEGWELKQYFGELTAAPVREYFRPNLWPNTPDILTEFLQRGGLPASALRLLLAATLGASYGVYGPVFELGENTPHMPGREDYLDSEKYEVRHWDLARPGLRELVQRINRIRRAHPALQQDRTLRFLNTDNERLLAYAKSDSDGGDTIVTVVNLDPRWRQSGWIEVPVVAEPGRPTYRVEDLLGGSTHIWRDDGWNFVELDPDRAPGHVFRVERDLSPEDPFGA